MYEIYKPPQYKDYKKSIKQRVHSQDTCNKYDKTKSYIYTIITTIHHQPGKIVISRYIFITKINVKNWEVICIIKKAHFEGDFTIYRYFQSNKYNGRIYIIPKRQLTVITKFCK